MRLWKAGIVLPVLGLAVMWAQVSPAGPPPSSIATSDPEIIGQGSRLFAKNCSPCHGKGAVGENPATPMGGFKTGAGDLAPALNGTGHAWHHPPAYFFRTIRNGSTLTFQVGQKAMRSRMLGWAGRMSDYEILSVIAYFQSLWPEHIKQGYRQRYLHKVFD